MIDTINSRRSRHKHTEIAETPCFKTDVRSYSSRRITTDFIAFYKAQPSRRCRRWERGHTDSNNNDNHNYIIICALCRSIDVYTEDTGMYIYLRVQSILFSYLRRCRRSWRAHLPIISFSSLMHSMPLFMSSE